MAEAIPVSSPLISGKSGEPSAKVVGFNAERRKRATVDTLLDELVPVAFGATIADLVNDDGEFLHPLEWTPEQAAAVERISVADGRVVAVVMKDKVKALAMLFRLTSEL